MRGGLVTTPGLSCAAWMLSVPDCKERSLSAGLNTSQINRHPRHSSRHASQSCIVDLVRGIGRAVVMLVPEQGRIRHHDRGIAFFPKGPVVRPADSHDPSRGGDAFRWNGSVL